jgi:hypothetical protein
MLYFYNYKWHFEAYFSEFRFLKCKKSVKTCHSLFVIVSILGKGLEFELVRWKGPILIYIHCTRVEWGWFHEPREARESRSNISCSIVSLRACL